MTASSSASAKAAETMSSAPFSYAQAAKAAPPVSLPQHPNPAQSKDTAIVMGASAESASSESTRVEASQPAPTTQVLETSAPGDATSAAIFTKDDTQRLAGTQDEDTMSTDSRPRSIGNAVPQPPSTRESSVGTNSDGKKGRKNKKSKDQNKQENDSASEEPPREEAPKVALTEAPVPSVNPWLARVAAKQPNGPVTTSTQMVKSSSDSGSKRAPDQKPNGANSVRTTSDTGDAPRPNNEQQPRRSGPRGGRAADKEGEKASTEALPPVHDASLWPTLDKAAAGEDNKRKQDKPEQVTKEDQAEAAPKQTKGKTEWTKLDVQPTFKFNTQITRPTRGGRGGGRSGRDSGARVGTGDGSGAGPSGSPSSARTTNESRGRVREGTNSRIAQGQPTASKRSPDGARQDARKPSVVSNKETTQDNTAMTKNGQPKNKADLNSHGDQSHPTGRGNGDRATQKDGVKEFAQNNRDREGRADRGRGSFRSRGGGNGHGHSQSQQIYPNSQAFSQQMSQQRQGPFSPNSQNSYSGGAFQGPPPRGRNGSRGGYNRGASGMNGVHRAAQIQTTGLPAYDYSAMPMSAPPYQGAFYEDPMIQMAMVQIEYYFSITNFCKDMYLRSHMNNDGLVPLEMILTFNRMRQLQVTTDMARMACLRSSQVDLYECADGVSRVRTRGEFKPFILEPKFRSDHGRVETNGQFWIWDPHAHHGMPTAPPHPMGYPTYPQSAIDPAHQQYYPPQYPYMANGINGHSYGPESHLAPNAPEFAPAGPNTNGGTWSNAHPGPHHGHADSSHAATEPAKGNNGPTLLEAGGAVAIPNPEVADSASAI